MPCFVVTPIQVYRSKTLLSERELVDVEYVPLELGAYSGLDSSTASACILVTENGWIRHCLRDSAWKPTVSYSYTMLPEEFRQRCIQADCAGIRIRLWQIFSKLGPWEI